MTTNEREALQQLRQIVAGMIEVPAERIATDAPILEEYGLDSIELMRFMLAVEAAFPQIDFEDQSMADIETLAQLARRISAS